MIHWLLNIVSWMSRSTQPIRTPHNERVHADVEVPTLPPPAPVPDVEAEYENAKDKTPTQRNRLL